MHKSLPKYYHFIKNLNIGKIQKLNSNVVLIYRNYEKKPNLSEIINFKNYCKKNRRTFIISKYYDIALKYKLDGIYIPSFYKKKLYKNFKYKKRFLILGSAHSYKEIKEKELQGVHLIMISPVFKNKNNRQQLGLYRYNLLKNFTKLPTIPLGGINNKNIKLFKMLNEYRFAAINFFMCK